MESLAQKSDFLKHEFTERLAAIDPGTKPLWGKMNVQQMVEHMSYAIQLAGGKLQVKQILTPEENLPRMQAFVQSEKQFRENTPNALLPDEPEPVRHPSMAASIAALQQDINDFFAHYEAAPGTKELNPFFGELDIDMQVQLLFKHAQHHLRQFGAPDGL